VASSQLRISGPLSLESGVTTSLAAIVETDASLMMIGRDGVFGSTAALKRLALSP
jgi:hypothetical protein